MFSKEQRIREHTFPKSSPADSLRSHSLRLDPLKGTNHWQGVQVTMLASRHILITS